MKIIKLNFPEMALNGLNVNTSVKSISRILNFEVSPTQPSEEK